jgi:hypothetical protein
MRPLPAAELLRELQYKPGAELALFWNEEIFTLHVSTPTLDIKTLETTNIRQWATRPIDYLTRMDETGFTQFVRQCIREMELHEIDEWFKRNNQNVTDPHPPENNFFPRFIAARSYNRLRWASMRRRLL